MNVDNKCRDELKKFKRNIFQRMEMFERKNEGSNLRESNSHFRYKWRTTYEWRFDNGWSNCRGKFRICSKMQQLSNSRWQLHACWNSEAPSRGRYIRRLSESPRYPWFISFRKPTGSASSSVACSRYTYNRITWLDNCQNKIATP